jgi:hypothetical protein
MRDDFVFLFQWLFHQRLKSLQMKYWILVASRDHARHGMDWGIAQVCHGKAAPLKRLHKGDGVIYYSSKTFFDEPEKCQCFTAIGKVSDDVVYQADMGNGFVPFRRAVSYFPSREVPIEGLIASLDFIQNKKSWGYPFRFGIIEISREDFETIGKEMMTGFDDIFQSDEHLEVLKQTN